MFLWSSCKRWLGMRSRVSRPIVSRRPARSAHPRLEALEDRCVPAVAITNFSAGITSGSSPYGITAGPDGNLWFTEFTGGQFGDGAIGRVTTTGGVTEFTSGISSNAGPQGITAGPDGALWFTEYGASQIGRITTGGTITEYSAGITAGSHPLGITAGPDGNLWFTEYNGGPDGDGAIGRITPSGVVTEFTAGISAGAQPDDIVAGPDGNLWFTENGTNAIGEFNLSTDTVTEFSTGITAGSGLRGLTVGSDGNLWFIEGTGNRIGKFTLAANGSTPAHAVTEYSMGLSPGANLEYIAAGPDGALWFTENGANNVGRITTGGVITEYSIGASLSSGPMGIAAGPDGNIWFAEYNASAIGRLSGVQAVTTTTLTTSDAAPVYGETVVLTATIAAPLSGPNAAPTGVVSFYDGNQLIGAGAVSGNIAILTTNTLSVGTHDLTAVYAGNATFAASTSNTVQETVSPVDTNTTVTSTGVPTVYGQNATFTATVSPASSSATPTGAVAFYDNGMLLGTATLSGGLAVLTTAALSVGNHSNITAQYLPTANFNPSNSLMPADQVVNAAGTSMTLNTSTGQPVYGQPVVLTAFVGATNSPQAPTGVVSFYDGMTLLGTSPVSGGAAALSTASLTTGVHSTINAVYTTATSDFQNAMAGLSGSVTVSPALTGLTLSSSASLAAVGQVVVYTATVSDQSPGTTALPTGYVTFLDNGYVIGASTLSAGLAALAVTPTTSGMQSITANYSPGDGNFAAATSLMPLTQQLNPGAPAELLFRQQPAFSLTNTPFLQPVTVTLADAYGNPVSTNTQVTIALGSNPGAATLSGTRVAAAINGVATFPNLTLNRVGSGYTLLATSGALARSTSSPFTISSVTHFGITVSTTKVKANTAVNVTITALNSAGAVDPHYLGTVTIFTTDSTLPITYTFTSTDAGRHTFTGVVFLMTSQVSVRDVQFPQLYASKTIAVTAAPGTVVLKVAEVTATDPKKLLE